jgi:hypothetical protein
MDQDERARRIGLNEAVFREVNERIEDLAATFGLEPLDLLCECGDASCTKRIEMDHKRYEELRSDSTTFAVACGHERPDVEEVIARHRSYYIVRKVAGAAREVAERTDRR